MAQIRVSELNKKFLKIELEITKEKVYFKIINSSCENVLKNFQG